MYRPAGATDPSEPALSNAEHVDVGKTEEHNITLSSRQDLRSWIPIPPGWPRERYIFGRDTAVELPATRPCADSGYSGKGSSGDQHADLDDTSGASATELHFHTAQCSRPASDPSSADTRFHQNEDPPSSTSFRLLRIWDNATPIKCTLEFYDLADHPDYYALSYTWHTAEEKLTASAVITVNFHEMKITPNLYKILLYLQTSKQLMPLWIDQICIDQHDRKDQASQVSIMAEIYKNAKATIVWVENAGKSTHSSRSELSVSRIYPIFCGPEQTHFPSPHQPSYSFPAIVQEEEQVGSASATQMSNHNEGLLEDEDDDFEDSGEDFRYTFDAFQTRVIEATVRYLKKDLVTFSRRFSTCFEPPDWKNASGFRTCTPSPAKVRSTIRSISKAEISSGANDKKRSSSGLQRRDDEGGDSPDHPKKRQHRSSKLNDDIRSIACPFNKFDPVRYSEYNTNPDERGYRRCAGVYLTQISRLK